MKKNPPILKPVQTAAPKDLAIYAKEVPSYNVPWQRVAEFVDAQIKVALYAILDEPSPFILNISNGEQYTQVTGLITPRGELVINGKNDLIENKFGHTAQPVFHVQNTSNDTVVSYIVKRHCEGTTLKEVHEYYTVARYWSFTDEPRVDVFVHLDGAVYDGINLNDRNMIDAAIVLSRYQAKPANEGVVKA